MRTLSLIFLIFSGVSAEAAKNFVYCSEASPKIFNPQLATDGPTFNASSRPLYNRLVEFEQGGTKVIPGLAESWKVDQSAKIYTFKLRKGVQFHQTSYFTPTRHLNADDVLFSFNRMRLKNHPYHNVNGGTYEYFNSMDMKSLIKDIKKLDDLTVQFELSRPEAPFVANLAMDFASILSQEYGEQLLKSKNPENMDMYPVGTGPFVFKKYVKDNVLRLEKNSNYFLGPARIDQLIFSITPDANVRFQKLKAGECHFIAEPAPADVASMKSIKSIKISQRPGLNVGYMAFNTQKKPFDNVLVRQALNMALNREAYLEAIYLGNAVKAKNPIPPSMWAYNDKAKSYSYDPKKARELLKKAGYENGFTADLWTLPVSRPYNPNGKKMGEMIQADLAKVGIKIKLVSYKWAEYLKRAAAGEHSMLQLGWTGDNGDPDNFLFVLLGCPAIAGGSNYARWCNREFQKHIEVAKQETNQQKRTTHYLKAQEIFKKEAPWVPLAHATVFKAMSARVEGYKQSPFGTESFYEVDLK